MGFFQYFYIFITASSVAPQIPLCRRMLELNPGQLRPWHRLSGALTSRLDLIYNLARSHPQLGQWSLPQTQKMISRVAPSLKGPKLEIFGTGVFPQIRPVWVGNLGTRRKNSKFLWFMLENRRFVLFSVVADITKHV